MIITKEAEICLFLNFSTFLVLLYFIDVVKVNKQRIKINFIGYSHSTSVGNLNPSVFLKSTTFGYSILPFD